MLCPLLESQHLLEDNCFSDSITAACESSEACPCKGQTIELGLARRQVLTRSCDFHYQRQLQGATGTYCTSESSWQRLQRFLLEMSSHSLLHEKEACELPMSSETFALTWLLYHVPMFREVRPSRQETSFWFTNDRPKPTLEPASASGCDGWFA